MKCKDRQPKLVSIQILELVFNPEFIKESKKKVRGDWKKLYNYDLRILLVCSSPHVIGILSSVRDDMKIREICTKFSLEF
jgi:hypothetical protein